MFISNLQFEFDQRTVFAREYEALHHKYTAVHGRCHSVVMEWPSEGISYEEANLVEQAY